MYCCISHAVPADPVVARPSGCLYERRLVETYIEEHGTCPVTGAPLRREDLIPVRAATAGAAASASGPAVAATATATAATGVPELLERLRAEWDASVLETFALRQREAQARLELAHAVQRAEAACRLVAVLTRERDELLAKTQQQGQQEQGKKEEDQPASKRSRTEN